MKDVTPKLTLAKCKASFNFTDIQRGFGLPTR